MKNSINRDNLKSSSIKRKNIVDLTEKYDETSKGPFEKRNSVDEKDLDLE
jgi:hypothetical protein